MARMSHFHLRTLYLYTETKLQLIKALTSAPEAHVQIPGPHTIMQSNNNLMTIRTFFTIYFSP